MHMHNINEIKRKVSKLPKSDSRRYFET